MLPQSAVAVATSVNALLRSSRNMSSSRMPGDFKPPDCVAGSVTHLVVSDLVVDGFTLVCTL